MPYTLTIETAGAAFEGDQLTEELSTILRRVAGTLTCLALGNADTGSIRDTIGNTVGHWAFLPDVDPTDLPEGTTATCCYCRETILLDQREGGGPGKDWGAGPGDWVGNGGTGMDYGCFDSPDSDDDATGGHTPDLDTIALP